MAIARKVIVLDITETEAVYVYAIGVVTLALGATYWLVGNADRCGSVAPNNSRVFRYTTQVLKKILKENAQQKEPDHTKCNGHLSPRCQGEDYHCRANARASCGMQIVPLSHSPNTAPMKGPSKIPGKPKKYRQSTDMPRQWPPLRCAEVLLPKGAGDEIHQVGQQAHKSQHGESAIAHILEIFRPRSNYKTGENKRSPGMAGSNMPAIPSATRVARAAIAITVSICGSSVTGPLHRGISFKRQGGRVV